MGALFGGGGGSNYTPPPPPPPPPPAAPPPTMANASVQQAGAMQRTRAASANGAGFGGTVRNTGGAGGLETATTAPRSLLG